MSSAKAPELTGGKLSPKSPGTPSTPLSPGGSKSSQQQRRNSTRRSTTDPTKVQAPVAQSIGIHRVAQAQTGKSIGIHDLNKRVSQSEGEISAILKQIDNGQNGDNVGAPAKRSPGLIKRGSTRLGLCSRNVIKDIAKSTAEEVDDVSEIVEEMVTAKNSKQKSINLEAANSESSPRTPVKINFAAKSKSFVEKRFLSMDLFYYPEQTVIVVDWDDTLFPTTWLEYDMSLPLDKPMPARLEVRKPLEVAMKRAEDFLRCARRLSNHVIILTLARSPWVQNCIRHFAPNLGKVLRDLEVRVVYARDSVAGARQDEYSKTSFESDEEEIAYWTNIKSEAIEKEVQRCYSQYEGQTWKNVVSIGDSDFEREGTKEMIKRWCAKNAKTAIRLPRTKTLKFLDEPTCEEISDQLKLVISWLPEIIKRDEGFNIDLDNAGNENLGGIEDLLVKSKEAAIEGPKSAVIEGHLWKLSNGGDPMHSGDWLKRRMWLSKKGQLWYESLQSAQYAQYFPGVKASQLIVSRAEGNFEMAAKISNIAVHGIRIQVPPYLNKQKSGANTAISKTPSGLDALMQTHDWLSHNTLMQTTFLAAESKQLRDDFIQHLEAFAHKAT